MFGFGLCAQKLVQETEDVVIASPKKSPCCGGQCRGNELVRAYPAAQPTHGVRTAVDEPVPAREALAALKEGNQRYRDGGSFAVTEQAWRAALAQHGQCPMAAIIGCADSRCPVDTLFDAKPGDLFVLRNAGNTCTHAEGSFVGSIEYAVEHLRTKLILVLGHTKCGAIAGATKCMLAQQQSNEVEQKAKDEGDSVLEVLLSDLIPVAQQAKAELSEEASFDELAAHAVKVNVFNTIERVIEYSDIVRDKARSGEVEVQGAIYNLESGKVEFLGRSPRQALLLGSQSSLVGRLNSAAAESSCTLSVARMSTRVASLRVKDAEQDDNSTSDASTATSKKSARHAGDRRK